MPIAPGKASVANSFASATIGRPRNLVNSSPVAFQTSTSSQTHGLFESNRSIDHCHKLLVWVRLIASQNQFRFRRKLLVGHLFLSTHRACDDIPSVAPSTRHA